MAQDPYRYFRVEARELLEQMGRGTLELERGLSAELVARLLRLAHTLKGAARVVKQRAMADRAHAFEEVLGVHRAAEAGASVPRADIDALLAHVDAMTGGLAALDAPPQAPPEPAVPVPAARPAENPPLAAPSPAQPTPSDELTDVAGGGDLTEVLDDLGEIHAQLGGLRKVTQVVDQARALVARLADTRAGALTELGQALDRARALLGTGLDQLERETGQARESVERMRLVPADALFTALQRTVRDSALSLGKRAVLACNGGDVRMDPAALATVQAALVQLVRNAIAHGIESPDGRAAAGKSPEGRITISVERRRAEILFVCTDDGKGIDLESVRRIARQKGLLASNVDTAAGADELLALLVRGGISTSGAVTEISGRGVGLDVARTAVSDLRGSLSIRSQAGGGTTVTLTVPAVLAAVPALVVDAGGAKAAIPLDAVRAALRINPADVARGPDGESLMHDGRAVPLVPLSAPLGLHRATGRRDARRSALVVEGHEGARAAVAVEQLIGTATLVTRPLPPRALASAVIAGAWMDAEGTPQLILDPAALVEQVRRTGAAPVEAETKRAPILVIDDSLTTRMLEQSILESAGYQVQLAASAEEGMEKALQSRYALFLVDVEMPGMDGFTFVEKTRLDPVLRDIPAILVSSRSAPEDLRRGMEVGASAYVVKGDFDQGALLSRIRTLIGGESAG